MKIRWIVFSLVFWGIAWVYAPRNFVDFGGDSAQYIILAESLAHGTGYHAINSPGAPFYYHYPPVFPILLTPVVYFFGRNFFLMHLLIALCGYGALLVFFHLFRKYSNDLVAFTTMIFTAISAPFVMYLLRYILSDVVFLLFMASAFFWFSCYMEKENALNREAGLTVFFSSLAYFTRYAGLTVFLSFLVILIFSGIRGKRGKIAVIVLGVAAPVVLWQMVCHLLNPGSVDRYMHQFSGIGAPLKFLAQAVYDAFYYILNIGIDLFVYTFALLGNIAGACFSLSMAGFAIFGVAAARRAGKAHHFLSYFLIYFILITVWPFGYGDDRETMRFILPLAPFLCFFIIYGLYALRGKLPIKIHGALFTACLAVIIFSFVFSLPNFEPWRHNIGLVAQDFIMAHRWIAKNGRGGEVVLSRKPSVSYFYSGHQAVIYPYTSDTGEVWRSIVDNRVKYVVVDDIFPQTSQFLLPAIIAHKKNIKPVYVAPHAAVFEVI